MDLYLGIDVGTTGCRTAVIDRDGAFISSSSVPMESPTDVDGRPCQDPMIWWQAVKECLAGQADSLQSLGFPMSDIVALAVDGTSGTMLLADDELNPVTLGYMYHSAGFHQEADAIAPHAPADTLARGPASALARLLFLQTHSSHEAAFALHQADWIAARLTGRGGMSDETNALKTGYDVLRRQWPGWIADCGVNVELLPEVRPVGDVFGTVCSDVSHEMGLSDQASVIAGATDSNAAFLASGASRVGDGATSLGTTLAIKLLSSQPVADSKRGIYSHRIKDMWLPGGASNSGGGVLLNHFSVQQMNELESELDPGQPTGLDYYPLVRPGERFPVADPDLMPRLTPRPDSDAIFFQAMLEGISEIERVGYESLEQLGAPQLQRVFTSGGGANNQAWTKIRAAKLGVPIVEAASSNAAVGSARIAANLI